MRFSGTSLRAFSDSRPPIPPSPFAYPYATYSAKLFHRPKPSDSSTLLQCLASVNHAVHGFAGFEKWTSELPIFLFGVAFNPCFIWVFPLFVYFAYDCGPAALPSGQLDLAKHPFRDVVPPFDNAADSYSSAAAAQSGEVPIWKSAAGGKPPFAAAARLLGLPGILGVLVNGAWWRFYIVSVVLTLVLTELVKHVFRSPRPSYDFYANAGARYFALMDHAPGPRSAEEGRGVLDRGRGPAALGGKTGGGGVDMMTHAGEGVAGPTGAGRGGAVVARRAGVADGAGTSVSTLVPESPGNPSPGVSSPSDTGREKSEEALLRSSAASPPRRRTEEEGHAPQQTKTPARLLTRGEHVHVHAGGPGSPRPSGTGSGYFNSDAALQNTKSSTKSSESSTDSTNSPDGAAGTSSSGDDKFARRHSKNECGLAPTSYGTSRTSAADGGDHQAETKNLVGVSTPVKYSDPAVSRGEMELLSPGHGRGR